MTRSQAGELKNRGSVLGRVGEGIEADSVVQTASYSVGAIIFLPRGKAVMGKYCTKI
jgi:hypothetical protein